MNTKSLLIAATSTALLAGSASAGLVAHWTFDEGTGTTVTDLANGNVGTFGGGGVTFSSTVPTAIGSGTSVSFSTANNQIVVPDSASLSLTSDFSIAVWINPIDDSGSARNIVAKGGNAAYRYRLSGNEGQWMLLNDGAGSPPYQLFNGAAGTIVTNGAWNHIAVTTDFTANELKFYLNGNLADTKTITETGVVDTAGDFLIGNYIAGNAESYRGLMDDLRIYDHALSVGEVSALVPEPSSLALLSLSGLLIARRRRS